MFERRSNERSGLETKTIGMVTIKISFLFRDKSLCLNESSVL